MMMMMMILAAPFDVVPGIELFWKRKRHVDLVSGVAAAVVFGAHHAVIVPAMLQQIAHTVLQLPLLLLLINLVRSNANLDHVLESGRHVI
jgi:sirohydrochlorin ferrochelatase